MATTGCHAIIPINSRPGVNDHCCRSAKTGTPHFAVASGQFLRAVGSSGALFDLFALAYGFCNRASKVRRPLQFPRRHPPLEMPAKRGRTGGAVIPGSPGAASRDSAVSGLSQSHSDPASTSCRGCCGWVPFVGPKTRRELESWATIAWPVSCTLGARLSMQIVDLAFVGRLSTQDLAAASLAFVRRRGSVAPVGICTPMTHRSFRLSHRSGCS